MGVGRVGRRRWKNRRGDGPRLARWRALGRASRRRRRRCRARLGLRELGDGHTDEDGTGADEPLMSAILCPRRCFDSGRQSIRARLQESKGSRTRGERVGELARERGEGREPERMLVRERDELTPPARVHVGVLRVTVRRGRWLPSTDDAVRARCAQLGQLQPGSSSSFPLSPAQPRPVPVPVPSPPFPSSYTCSPARDGPAHSSVRRDARRHCLGAG